MLCMARRRISRQWNRRPCSCSCPLFMNEFKGTCVAFDAKLFLLHRLAQQVLSFNRRKSKLNTAHSSASRLSCPQGYILLNGAPSCKYYRPRPISSSRSKPFRLTRLHRLNQRGSRVLTSPCSATTLAYWAQPPYLNPCFRLCLF